MALDMSMAPSQVAAALNGDQPTTVTPDGRSSVPRGSKSNVWPTFCRAVAVASITSCLVEVSTTDPGALRTFGMMMLVVFPDRVGPSTRVLR